MMMMLSYENVLLLLYLFEFVCWMFMCEVDAVTASRTLSTIQNTEQISEVILKRSIQRIEVISRVCIFTT